MQAWKVHKFGGSSVADAACMQRVAEIIEGDPVPRKAVVLSACRGVTDALLNLVTLAEQQDAALDDRIEALRQRHIDMARELLAGELYDEFVVDLDRDCHDIAGILQTVRLVRAASTTLRDLIAGYGELWSTRLFERLLRRRGRSQGRVQWLDARRVLLVEWGPLGPGVRWEQSRANLQAAVPPDFTGTVVITGFIATDSQGLQTTLGRNGSDFSASIFGSLFDAGEIVIWTDVDGVLSADPRLVPEAQVIDALSYNEAMELAYFGAKVIHPQTMAPAVQKRIPIWIKNTFAPDAPGTLIHDRTAPSPLVKGITTVEHIALVNLEGAGMIGVPGTAHRLFGALREEGISVILISQGSSEHSICFAVPEPEADRAERVVRRAFEPELREGQIQSVEVNRSCSILAVVGDGMAGAHGVAAQVFAALAKASVNVRAIAQGASERNISVVIDGRGSARALRAVHSSFYLSAHTVSIGLIGPGLVGSALLDQVASQVERLRRDFKLDLRVRGIAGSKSMRLTQGSIDLARWRDEYAVGGDPVDLERFADHVHADQFPHAVIIDCSASAAVASRYAHWLSQGIHIVTPNKKANSAAWGDYERVRAARRAAGSHYLYEATVGAGLPVIQTLRDLRETGDEIRRIEGIFSGTLAYLFNTWDGSESFSSVVKQAKALGYTEPDPRDDLSGMDVARKLIILAREMGLKLELGDAQVESLVPGALADCGVEDFLARLHEFDAPMLARLEAARARGHVLRYVGSVDVAGHAQVGVVELPASHPFANIALTDNIVRFQTARYDRNPLIVQGPGAGPAVTAAGVFADLLRVCAYLGAKL
ncbi:MAG TPA: bifunctional aspartate kinase/homoserine dehydrogenase I [Steroidobacteraceae bacterium]|nr:bifunctional aspartate kinase/homoserine dehydrogenase I [Steroidobacteraceae bacterium]